MTALADSEGNLPSGYVRGEWLDDGTEAFTKSFEGEQDELFVTELARHSVYDRGIKLIVYISQSLASSYDGVFKVSGYYEYQPISTVSESMQDSDEYDVSYQPAINPTRIELLIS